MIGCSQHRSKEDPDANMSPHTQTNAHRHTRTHMGIRVHKALVDGNALGRAPSHHVKRHTSTEFVSCHMGFTRRQTNSHPSHPGVQIYHPPSAAHVCCSFPSTMQIKANSISYVFVCGFWGPCVHASGWLALNPPQSFSIIVPKYAS